MKEDYHTKVLRLSRIANFIGWMTFFVCIGIFLFLTSLFPSLKAYLNDNNIAILSLGLIIGMLSWYLATLAYNIVFLKYPDEQFGKTNRLIIQYSLLCILLISVPINLFYENIHFEKHPYFMGIFLALLVALLWCLYAILVFFICNKLYQRHPITKFKRWCVYIPYSINRFFPEFLVESDNSKNALEVVTNYVKKNRDHLIVTEDDILHLKCDIYNGYSRSTIRGENRIIHILTSHIGL